MRLRRTVAVLACASAASLLAGCATSAPPPSSVTGVNHLVAHKASKASHPSTGPTTTTTLASCGSARDPLDPTKSPPPAGSPAICPP